MQRRFFIFSLLTFVFAFILIGVGIGRVSLKTVSPTQIVLVPSPTVTAAPTGAVAGTVSDRVVVKKVIDGDTIELFDGSRVRYIGIDTPETVDPRRPVGCFGKEASELNESLVEGKEVELEKDVSETDRYGRLLRYVYVEVAGEKVMINDYLVRQGFATASSYPPDVKYQEQFRVAEQEAREQQRGFWNLCISSSNPQVESATQSAEAAIPQSLSGCTIKGNISSSGKIYHLPSCGSYNKTAIDESAGEKWFCSEEEAESAGWRKAKNC